MLNLHNYNPPTGHYWWGSITSREHNFSNARKIENVELLTSGRKAILFRSSVQSQSLQFLLSSLYNSHSPSTLGAAVLHRSAVSNALDPRDWSPPGSSVHGDSPGTNTGVGCHALLQGIFPTQGLNPGLLHCRWVLYLEVGSLPLVWATRETS